MSVFAKRYEQLGGNCVPVTLTPSIRVNTLHIKDAELVARLTKKGVTLKKIPFTAHGYHVESSKFSLGASIEYLRGLITPQEAASQLPVQVLDPKSGERVLDMAAAPGVKTSQLAQWMQNQGDIVSIEKNNRRLLGLKNNLERMGIGNCLVFNTDATKVTEWKLSFDKVLLDAPCMGNYVKDKDWLGKHSLKELDRNTLTQRSLLRAAVTLTKKGGAIVYSTCSLEPEENEQIIDWALRELPVRCIDMKLEIGSPGVTNVFGKRLHADVAKCRRFWPHETKTEGFFIAKLVRQ
jgi:NOL1/NOP2/sun family putative RNA methylase